jgi:D-aminoacyl-tRNA deacylase
LAGQLFEVHQVQSLSLFKERVNQALAIKLYGKPFSHNNPTKLRSEQMILLVHSNRDIAGVNIANHVLQRYPFSQTNRTHQENPIYKATINEKQVTYITLNEETVNAQNLPESFPNAHLIVFLSRHSSQSGTPTLSVHTPGNLAAAELGGLPHSVSIAPAKAMSDALKALNRLKQETNLNYEVSYECTHHGPSLQVPTMFVELGSCEKQWNDQTAGAVVAQAAMEAITNFGNTKRPAVLGIGGTHYNQKFTHMALNGEAVFGHMIPKYALPQIDPETLQQCIKRTQEQVESAILDWKGIKSQDKPKLLAALKETGLPTKKV